MKVICLVKNVKKKSAAKMFKDVKPNNILKFSIPIKSAGGYGGSYASYILIENLSQPGNIANKSFNQLPSVLYNFELEEIDEIVAADYLNRFNQNGEEII